MAEILWLGGHGVSRFNIRSVTLCLLSVIYGRVPRGGFPVPGEALSPSVRPGSSGPGLPARVFRPGLPAPGCQETLGVVLHEVVDGVQVSKMVSCSGSAFCGGA